MIKVLARSLEQMTLRRSETFDPALHHGRETAGYAGQTRAHSAVTHQ